MPRPIPRESPMASWHKISRVIRPAPIIRALVAAAAAGLALGPAAEAGTTHAGPPVHVVTLGASAPVEPDDLPGPQPEVARHPEKLELPAVPAFALPAHSPGILSPRELRIHAPR